MLMLPTSSSVLCGVLLGALFFSSTGAGAQPSQSGSAIGMMARDVEGLIVLPDFMLFLERRRVTQLAGQYRPPAISNCGSSPRVVGSCPMGHISPSSFDELPVMSTESSRAPSLPT